MTSATNQGLVVLNALPAVISPHVREHAVVLVRIAWGAALRVKSVKTVSLNQPVIAAAAGESASVSPTKVGVAVKSACIHA
jgi:hypothetical protein